MPEPTTSARYDTDATQGNERLARAAYIRERMQQEGCLAIEAARRWDNGRRCGACGARIPSDEGSCLCFDNGSA